MVRTAAEQADLEGLLFAALEYHASKRYDRDKLQPGTTPVCFKILATVGRAEVEISAEGSLEVGADQTTTSTEKADTSHVLAYVLTQLDESKRRSLLARLPRQFEAKKKLPKVAKARLTEVVALLKRLRSSGKGKKRGTVVFALPSGESDGQ